MPSFIQENEDIDLESYSEKIGFKEYPFATFTAENERKHINKLFTKPDIHHVVQTATRSGSSVIIYGDRGTGKTALLYSLEESIKEKTLIVQIDNFESLSIDHDKKELYEFILKNFIEQSIPYLAKKPTAQFRLSKDDRAFFSYLLKNYLNESSKIRIDEKLREIQIPIIKRLFIGLFNLATKPINMAANAGVTFASDILRKHIPWIVNVDSEKYVEYFKQIEIAFQRDFPESTASLEILRKACGIINKITKEKVYFILDKIDEDDRLDNDSDLISAFAKKVMADTKHFTSDEFSFIISIWTIPFVQIKDDLRTQKISTHSLTWDKSSLIRVLNKRIQHFSKGAIKSYKEILSEKISQKDEDEVFTLSNGNPRDLWHIFDKILLAQYSIDRTSTQISIDALEKAKKAFVEKFNYYEYYPKRINANTRTMDVYSYIALLGKLNKHEFTINSLKTSSGAGSGATNYVTKMQSMGLIFSSGKDGKSNKYKVRDPKIIYAIDNKIQIRKDGESIETTELDQDFEITEVEDGQIERN
ncbi:P-loop ATPase, Sll1717 family [Chromobacterium violaceum]|uniref:P-loop ATPase, Sll1717 family n=1 Tax=Chromobacterium violaceum TaxID=536 RepID=UPI000B17C76D|nr:P-loop NTPase fold protein [Chromobacterium violaceum]